MTTTTLLRQAIREIAAPMTGMRGGRQMPDRISWGGFALGPSVGQQVREEDPVVKRAACVLIRRGGRVLAVSRKDDPTDMGTPGGKVDPDDGPQGELMTLARAAARELREETGLSIDPDRLRFVYEAQEDDGFTTTTFEAAWSDVRGPIRTVESGRVRWIDPDELCAGSFARYNTEMLEAADALPPLSVSSSSGTVQKASRHS